MPTFHDIATKEALKSLASRTGGLTTAEAKAGLKKHGRNALPEPKPPSQVQLIVRQFKSPLVYILLAAAGLSLAVHEAFDAVVILIAVFVNTVLGYIQENKATQAMAELRALVHPEARVRRGGDVMVVPADEVVPGDILVLESGDRVVADARLLTATNLQTNEAPLTGESLPVAKQVKKLAKGTIVSDRTNMVFMGTTVVVGRGEAVVTATALGTSLGETAKLVQEVKEESTPLQEQLSRLARILAIIVLVLAVFIVVIGVTGDQDLVEMITLGAAVAVAAIPEGLLVGLTVILAIGMQRILKQKALVRHLVAAETLGSVSVICTDKTGTITQGSMQVVELVTSQGSMDVKEAQKDHSKDVALAMNIAVLNNNATVEGDGLKERTFLGTPTEVALLTAGLHEGISAEELNKTHQRIAEIPFDSSYKYMATLNKWVGGKTAILMKGAPETLLKRATHVYEGGKKKAMTPAQHKKFHGLADEMTEKGLRVLAVGYKDASTATKTVTHEDLDSMVFVGLFGLADPLRRDAKTTLETAKKAGVRTVIITGDHPKTAYAIADSVGLKPKKGSVITGAELEKLSDKQFAARLDKIDVYARVLPPHKVRIVKAWKTRGETVAMIGDGVNDAPAIKAADIGVALGSGTEVAKQTSDMVLLNDHLRTLINAIRQGRVIFDNIRKVAVYLLSDGFSEMILIVGSLLFRVPLPILPAQILWINLVSDGFPHVALTLEPEEKGIMNEPPRKRNEPVLNLEMKTLVLLIGVVTDIGLFAIYFYLLNQGMPIDEIRTFIFVALGIDSLLYVFSVRSFRYSIFQVNPFRNKWLNGAVLVGFAFLILPLVFVPLRNLFGFVPLSLLEWVVLVMIGGVKVTLIELVKLVFNWNKRRQLA